MVDSVKICGRIRFWDVVLIDQNGREIQHGCRNGDTADTVRRNVTREYRGFRNGGGIRAITPAAD